MRDVSVARAYRSDLLVGEIIEGRSTTALMTTFQNLREIRLVAEKNEVQYEIVTFLMKSQSQCTRNEERLVFLEGCVV
jgi:hypothetical protein